MELRIQKYNLDELGAIYMCVCARARMCVYKSVLACVCFNIRMDLIIKILFYSFYVFCLFLELASFLGG